MKTPTVNRNKLRITLPQIVIIMGIAVSVWFLSEFSDMMKTSQTIRAQENQLLATVTALQDQQTSLKLTQAYISSDAYVERALRTELKYGLPEETHIVVITPVAQIEIPNSLAMSELP
ncbi:MAG: hypothetical protein VX237_00095, partial [Chloroflexota bacterium]|nr:hypothetical protein [Chloroflexota bacterium]